MSIPTNEEILEKLKLLDSKIADSLESQYLDFKPWNDVKKDMKIAMEYAVCFANSDGGVVVFGVSDKVIGRQNAIHGVEGYDLDTWQRGIYDGIRPHIPVEVSELSVSEGTGRLLVVRVPKGTSPPYGTVGGLYTRRVGKNCMPLDPAEFQAIRVSTGVVDWSGQPAQGVTVDDLDPLEIARARAYLRSRNPNSGLLQASDNDFLKGLGAIRFGEVTNTGLLLFGKPDVIAELCPQNQVHYVHQVTDVKVARMILGTWAFFKLSKN